MDMANDLVKKRFAQEIKDRIAVKQRGGGAS
jgi:hypothetical protein